MLFDIVMNIDKILEQQEKLNKNNKFSAINKETGHFIHLLIKMKRPKNVLEIGTSIGYSSLWIASALKRNSKLITIEKWKERANIARKFFKKAKLPIKTCRRRGFNTNSHVKNKV